MRRLTPPFSAHHHDRHRNVSRWTLKLATAKPEYVLCCGRNPLISLRPEKACFAIIYLLSLIYFKLPKLFVRVRFPPPAPFWRSVATGQMLSCRPLDSRLQASRAGGIAHPITLPAHERASEPPLSPGCSVRMLTACRSVIGGERSPSSGSVPWPHSAKRHPELADCHHSLPTLVALPV